ncbi:MAG: PaaI family thioesterase [Dehalococcoidia bacterium]|nr:PaaI family thioesterase [Dehalococcoidia bacterium]
MTEDELKAIYTGRFWAHMGIEVVEVAEGRCHTRIRLQEHHFNYNDVVHGGVISGLVDSVAGLAVRSLRPASEIRERPHATSNLHIQYLSPARGTELVGRSHVIKAGRTAFFVDVEISDDRGQPVARGNVTFVIGTSHSRRRLD